MVDSIPSGSSGTATEFDNGHHIAAFPDWVEDHRPHHGRRKSSERRSSITREPGSKSWWKFKLRPWDDDQERDWWFAGTAIPLLAATIGPLANVLSIAALVTYWRMCLVDGVETHVCPWDGNESSLLAQLDGHTYRDPRWCYDLNVLSVVMGFIGNIFLLFNFTGRVRYMIALPVTIVTWYFATGILTGITSAMEVYVPPTRPQQSYTQGFWYAVIAAILYLTSSMLLMINMLGYFLGHYPQQFNLTDSQRTLILQTMLFFIWLAGGAGIFSVVETKYGNGSFSWSYVNSLYFCDVTILTVGFGDIYPTSNVGRGLVFPYSVGGIIMLGLMISSITKFASELGQNKVLYAHIERNRTRTIGRSVTTSLELQDRERLALATRGATTDPVDPSDRRPTLRIVDNKKEAKNQATHHHHHHHNNNNNGPGMHGMFRMGNIPFQPLKPKKPRLILLREEKDRFDAMRKIQDSTIRWKRWYALTMSIIAFGILWCIGAVVFWQAEKHAQEISYFESLYLCYVSLITIGYGDLAPKSNAGRPFFVVWSLVAVPTMTILIADLGDTVISDFKNVVAKLGDFTVLPEKGIWHRFLLTHPYVLKQLERRSARKEAKRRLSLGFEVGPETEAHPTLDTLAVEEVKKPSDWELGRKLARAIRHTAKDLAADPPKVYTYEEWVEFTELIRFTSKDETNKEGGFKEEGLVEWDWLGENSPMMQQENEADFVLDRLCESMARYIRHLAPKDLDIERPLDVKDDEDSMKENGSVKAKEGPDVEPTVDIKRQHMSRTLSL
ncbi:hypothetical protein BDV97DRAFT_372536 [Delphinella strobiligena]|nr:hypothetical protein BDV97DRAFT_372536 [Delphinella strobiligena]